MFNKFIASASLAVLSLGASAATNLVADGSFEDTLVNPHTYAFFFGTVGTPNSANPAGAWTTGAVGLEIRDNSYGTTPFGKNFVELDTFANSSISQNLTTKVGQTYLLSFWVENRAGVDASSQGISYSAGSTSNTIAGSLISYTNWTKYTAKFKATSTSTALSFAAAGTSDSYGTSLDNISVTAVPEPASVAMLIGGLALVGVARRRNSHKA